MGKLLPKWSKNGAAKGIAKSCQNDTKNVTQISAKMSKTEVPLNAVQNAQIAKKWISKSVPERQKNGWENYCQNDQKRGLPKLLPKSAKMTQKMLHKSVSRCPKRKYL